MKYEDYLKGRNGKPEGDNLVTMIQTWKEEGQYIIGRLKSIDKFEGGNFDSECKQYLFETDDGLVSTVMGAAVDKQLEKCDVIGDILFVEYQGKIALDDGRHVNKFVILNITKDFNHEASELGDQK